MFVVSLLLVVLSIFYGAKKPAMVKMGISVKHQGRCSLHVEYSTLCMYDIYYFDYNTIMIGVNINIVCSFNSYQMVNCTQAPSEGVWAAKKLTLVLSLQWSSQSPAIIDHENQNHPLDDKQPMSPQCKSVDSKQLLHCSPETWVVLKDHIFYLKGHTLHAVSHSARLSVSIEIVIQI